MLFERFGLVGSPDRKKQRRGSAGPNALQSSAAKAGPSPHAINSSGESLDHLPRPYTLELYRQKCEVVYNHILSPTMNLDRAFMSWLLESSFNLHILPYL